MQTPEQQPKEEIKEGQYIAVEGPDGSGKTVACHLIDEILQEYDQCIHQVNILKHHKNSLALRTIVTDPKTKMHPRTELAYYIAAVLNTMTEVVMPMKLCGLDVISDRGPDSSLVYQAMSLGDNDPTMLQMHQAAFAGLSADVTIFLEPASAQEGLDRVTGRDGEHDRIEQRGSDYQDTVIQNYRALHDAKGYRGDKVFWVKNDSTIEQLKLALKNVLLLSGVLKLPVDLFRSDIKTTAAK